MRIAILGSVSTIIPPQGQAAIERLAYQQAVGLAERGNEILLFCLQGSQVVHPNVRMITVGSGEARSGQGNETNYEALYGTSYKLRLEIVNLAQVLANLITLKDQYDVILNNLRGEAILLPIARELNKTFFHVLHLPVFPELAELFKAYKTQLISISNAQQKANPDLNYAGTVYNAVDTNEFTYSPTHQNYVLYLGSIGKNKNPRDAILAAQQAGEKMLIGGRIKDTKYYESEIKPLIDGTQIQWVGEKHGDEIVKLYQGAKVFLFPTLWEEPFGLVLIEAMSCGTPVIAYPHGAIPEIVTNGKDGFLVNSVAEMAAKIKEIDTIKREDCRKYVEENFALEKMIVAYEVLLKTLVT